MHVLVLGLELAYGRYPVHLRHAQVYQDDMRYQPGRQGHGVRAVDGFSDHLEVGLGRKHVPQAGSHDGVVVGDQGPNTLRHRVFPRGGESDSMASASSSARPPAATGTAAISVQPSPGLLSTISAPRNCSTRSRMPVSPNPLSSCSRECGRKRAGSKPTPSSCTFSVTRLCM